MTLSRSSRVVVAWLAALLLVLCQTAFAAQACAADAHVGTTTAAAPCHEAADAGSNTAAHNASACEAAKAVADSVKIPVFDVSDMPAVIAAIHTPIARNASLAIQHVQAVCHSPPLTLLHCRFLN